MFKAVEFDDAAKKRIQEAVSFEKRLRLEAYLNVTSQIGPFRVRPLLMKHALEMEYVENRLNLGQTPETEDLVHFLWVVRSKDETRTEKDFTKFVVKKMTADLFEDVCKYHSLQFLDLPSSKKSSSKIQNFESSIWLTPLIDQLSNQYGWSIREVMNTPVSVALQLLQQIRMRHDPKASSRNPITQAAKAQEMKKLTSHG